MKFNIPVFIEDIAPDATNAKYSKAKLKMFYVGETADHRIFTKDFSDKLLASLPYTPIVGYYSVADDDFHGHNELQHIYGVVPGNADNAFEYVEDAEQGVTFAVTDVLLYTGRPDETGAIAAKIVGKQHSLELNPATVKYKVNRDANGKFMNLEFTEGELIGLSVLGDNDTPAFTGSEFFSTEELPDFINDDNKSRYTAFADLLFSVEPTAQEQLYEIMNALYAIDEYGYVAEHIADQYVVVNCGCGKSKRYTLSRANGAVVATYDCNVHSRYLSDEEIAFVQEKKKNGNTEENTNMEAQGAADNSVSYTEEQYSAIVAERDAALNTIGERDTSLAECAASIETLNHTITELQNSLAAYTNAAKEAAIAEYADDLDVDTLDSFRAQAADMSVEELKAQLALAFRAATRSHRAANINFVASLSHENSHQYDEHNADDVINKYKK